MAKKSKKGGGGSGVIAAVILLLIVGSIISAAPWLLIIIVPIAVLAAIGSKKDGKSGRRPSAAGSAPLSTAVNNDLRIVSDCVNLLNTSTNLQTVISRYDVLVDALTRLSGYEGNPAVSFPRELPSETLVRISGEQSEIFNRAIRRAYDDVLHKCAALKTEKGRKNRQTKFFDELNALMPSFPPATQDFVVQFVNEHINEPVPGGGS